MNTNNLNQSSGTIKDLGFDQVWSGASHASHRASLTSMMTQLDNCIADVNKFEQILVLKENYIKICERIQELYRAISSCSSSHTEEQNENGCGTCGSYASEIRQKETERKELREKIIGMLGEFSGIDVEISDPVDFSVESNSPVPDNQNVINEVPRYNQLEYTCPYGNVTLDSNGARATVRNSGCGITCLAMVATYMNDDPTLTPDVLAERYGKYNTSVGSAWSLFTETSQELGLGEVRQVHDWGGGEIEQALRDGCLVISNQRGGKFTSGGHYILLTGISEVENEDGTVDIKIHVNDPNGANWGKGNMVDGFENGFRPEDIRYTSAAYWIYDPKKNNEE